MLHQQALPNEVEEARARADAAAPEIDKVIQPYIDELVGACRWSLGVLTSMHEQLVDNTDLDLEADTRWVAIWELSGHAIALGNGLLDQVEAGHVAALGGTARALVETLPLMLAMAAGEEPLVRRWLRGKYISPKAARGGQRRYYARVLPELNKDGAPLELHPAYRAQREELKQLGIDPDSGAADVLDTITERVYGNLSGVAHSTRTAIEPSVAVKLRRFAYGRHPEARVRLRFAVEAAGFIETTVLDVSAGLAEIAGVDAVKPHAMNAQMRIRRAMASMPVPHSE